MPSADRAYAREYARKYRRGHGWVRCRVPARLLHEVKVHCAARGVFLHFFISAAIREKLGAPPDAPSDEPKFPYIDNPWLPDELRLLPDPMPEGYMEALELAGVATHQKDGSWWLWPS